MKTLAILGSTGSIGRNTLDIVAMFPERFRVAALAARTSVDLLAEQIVRFKPLVAAVYDDVRAAELRNKLPSGTEIDIRFGDDGYRAAAVVQPADIVVSAMVGASGLAPTMAAIEAGKTIALANKETLVMAGDIVMNAAREQGVPILPVDSEHSAIFQCLLGQRGEALERIILTASGGPFRQRAKTELTDITPEEALRHPTWNMGAKITIDSATLMNKGLEVIEAVHLFDLSCKQIDVVVHPQSIVHSMVAFQDGSILAQMGVPDMKTAIAFALSYPERLPLGQPMPDFTGIGALTFEPPDMDKFPCLAIAYEASAAGGTLPAVMNAANEVAVHHYLQGRLPFGGIPEIIRAVMDAHSPLSSTDVSNIMTADAWARRRTEAMILSRNA